MPVTILAIESSCDETSAAVMVNGELKSNIISTQPPMALKAGLPTILPYGLQRI